MANAPEPGWSTRAKVYKVKDADSIEVEVTRRFTVRIENLRIAEADTPRGIEATRIARILMPKGREVTVFIPSNNPERLMDINSFERLVGEIWLDDVSYRDIMRKEGFDGEGN